MLDKSKLDEILNNKCIDLEEVERILRDIKSPYYLDKFTELQHVALNAETLIFNTGSIEGDFIEMWYLMRQVEFLWDDAVLLLRNNSRASSVFFSIMVIEGVGMLAVARFQIFQNRATLNTTKSSIQRKKKGPLFDHKHKHRLGVYSGFAINSRAVRILGLDNIKTLLGLAENGKLATIRENSLYHETIDGRLSLPLTKRTHEDAVFFCTAAGELLAEIGGIVPVEFERLIARVEDFENKFPLVGYKLVLDS